MITLTAVSDRVELREINVVNLLLIKELLLLLVLMTLSKAFSFYYYGFVYVFISPFALIKAFYYYYYYYLLTSSF